MKLKKSIGILLAMVLGVMLSVVVGAGRASADPGCQQGGVYVLWARGSGQGFDASTAQAFRHHLEYALRSKGMTRLEWAELGNLDQDRQALAEDGEYPAVPIDGWDAANLANGNYNNSVTVGMNELVTHLNRRYGTATGDWVSGCAQETLILGGYSQGADVIGWALRQPGLSQAAKDHIGFVALYGDPRNDCYTTTARGMRCPPEIAGASLTARSIPAEFEQRARNWCDVGDNVCTGHYVAKFGEGNHGRIYQDYWIWQSAAEIAGAIRLRPVGAQPTDPTLYHGTPPNGALVENADGGNHKYVAIGGSLVWIPPTENIWDYVHQMQRLHPSGQFHDILRMRSDEIHAMEYGFGGNRAHVPGDNSFLYEHGSQQQYVVHYGYSFAVGTAEEVDYLGGRDRAVMVPAGTAGRLSGVPPIPNDVLLQSLTNPTVYHQVNGMAYRVPGVPTLDCIRTVKHGSVQPVTVSLLAVLQNAGRLTAQPTSCDFTHGQVLVGQPSNRQTIVLYGAGFAIGSPQEAVAVGAANRAVPVSDETVDGLLARTPSVPQGHVFRAGLDTKAYHYVDAKFHHIGSPATRDCLLARGSLGTGEEVVPASFIARYPTGPPAYCELENRQLLAPNGVTVGYVQDGFRRPVTNPAIRDCIAVRRGAGAPLAVTDNVWNSYTPGPNAYCPYERENGLNFVQEAGSPTVWLVQAPTIPGQPATKRHVGSLCVPDPYTTQLKQYHVWTVPAGETGGHVPGEDWWADGPKCQALPQG